MATLFSHKSIQIGRSYRTTNRCKMGGGSTQLTPSWYCNAMGTSSIKVVWRNQRISGTTMEKIVVSDRIAWRALKACQYPAPCNGLTEATNDGNYKQGAAPNFITHFDLETFHIDAFRWLKLLHVTKITVSVLTGCQLHVPQCTKSHYVLWNTDQVSLSYLVFKKYLYMGFLT